jgi:hypothetical protein
MENGYGVGRLSSFASDGHPDEKSPSKDARATSGAAPRSSPAEERERARARPARVLISRRKRARVNVLNKRVELGAMWSADT